jgi:hypothetical protein
MFSIFLFLKFEQLVVVNDKQWLVADGGRSAHHGAQQPKRGGEKKPPPPPEELKVYWAKKEHEFVN